MSDRDFFEGTGVGYLSRNSRPDMVIFQDSENESQEILYFPSDTELIETFVKYGLDVNYSLKMIEDSPSDVYSVLFELIRYRQHLKSIGF